MGRAGLGGRRGHRRDWTFVREAVKNSCRQRAEEPISIYDEVATCDLLWSRTVKTSNGVIERVELRGDNTTTDVQRDIVLLKGRL